MTRHQRDSLDGILLGVYRIELEELNRKTLEALRLLVQEGIVEEFRGQKNETSYRLTGDELQIQNYLSQLTP